MTTCNTDKNKESLWPGGWDELTPIYVRSTDKNPTLQSAMYNFIGFYSSTASQSSGVWYPSSSKWPKYYIPTPIHTVKFQTNHLLNPNAICPRQHWLWSNVKKTNQYQNLVKRAAQILPMVSTKCNQLITVDSLWEYRDAFQIELEYGLNIPASENILQEMIQINNVLDDLQNGIDVSPYNGIDFEVEIPKIRGGSLLWDIINRSALKVWYRRNSTVEIFEEITHFVRGCPQQVDSYCSFNSFRTAAKEYYPGDVQKLCEDMKSKHTLFDPEQPSLSAPLSTSLCWLIAALFHLIHFY